MVLLRCVPETRLGRCPAGLGDERARRTRTFKSRDPSKPSRPWGDVATTEHREAPLADGGRGAATSGDEVSAPRVSRRRARPYAKPQVQPQTGFRHPPATLERRSSSMISRRALAVLSRFGGGSERMPKARGPSGCGLGSSSRRRRRPEPERWRAAVQPVRVRSGQ